MIYSHLPPTRGQSDVLILRFTQKQFGSRAAQISGQGLPVAESWGSLSGRCVMHTNAHTMLQMHSSIF